MDTIDEAEVINEHHKELILSSRVRHDGEASFLCIVCCEKIERLRRKILGRRATLCASCAHDQALLDRHFKN